MKTKPYITIDGVETSKLISAVQMMANLYSDLEFVESIEISKSEKDEDKYLIEFRIKPDFERFKYFVNYLHYPQVENYNASVKGYWTIDKSDKLPQKHTAQRVMLFIPESDNEGDNVYAKFKSEDKTYKFGFAIGENYQEVDNVLQEFEDEKISKFENKLIKTISPDPDAKKGKQSSGCLGSFMFLLTLVTWTLMK